MKSFLLLLVCISFGYASYQQSADKQIERTVKHTAQFKRERISLSNTTKLTKIIFLDFKHITHMVKNEKR